MKSKLTILFITLFTTLILVTTSSHIFADDVYFTSSPSFTVNTGAMYSYQISAQDTQGNTFAFSFPNLPSWLSFNSSTNTISGTTQTPGRYLVNITATDAQGSSEQQDYFLYVINTQSQATVTPSLTIAPPSAITPTTTPNSQQIQLETNQVNLESTSPVDGVNITSTSPVITGDIETSFALDKANFSIFMDANEVSANTMLVTNQKTSQDYSNLFTYKASNLSSGRHTINITVTTPDGITIPKSWSFTIQPATTGLGNSLQNATKNINFLPIILVILLLLFIIIIVKLIRKSPETGDKTPSTKTKPGQV